MWKALLIAAIAGQAAAFDEPDRKLQLSLGSINKTRITTSRRRRRAKQDKELPIFGFSVAPIRRAKVSMEMSSRPKEEKTIITRVEIPEKPKKLNPPKTTMGALGPAWTRGLIERPLGTKDMGTYQAAVYTQEQMSRLGIDEFGKKRAFIPTNFETWQNKDIDFLSSLSTSDELFRKMDRECSDARSAKWDARTAIRSYDERVEKLAAFRRYGDSVEDDPIIDPNEESIITLRSYERLAGDNDLLEMQKDAAKEKAKKAVLACLRAQYAAKDAYVKRTWSPDQVDVSDLKVTSWEHDRDQVKVTETAQSNGASLNISILDQLKEEQIALDARSHSELVVKEILANAPQSRIQQREWERNLNYQTKKRAAIEIYREMIRRNAPQYRIQLARRMLREVCKDQADFETALLEVLDQEHMDGAEIVHIDTTIKTDHVAPVIVVENQRTTHNAIVMPKFHKPVVESFFGDYVKEDPFVSQEETATVDFLFGNN